MATPRSCQICVRTYVQNSLHAVYGQVRREQGLVEGMQSRLFPSSQLPSGKAEAESAEEDGTGGGDNG
jgi:hypothetical protein